MKHIPLIILAFVFFSCNHDAVMDPVEICPESFVCGDIHALHEVHVFDPPLEIPRSTSGYSEEYTTDCKLIDINSDGILDLQFVHHYIYLGGSADNQFYVESLSPEIELTLDTYGSTYHLEEGDPILTDTLWINAGHRGVMQLFSWGWQYTFSKGFWDGAGYLPVRIKQDSGGYEYYWIYMSVKPKHEIYSIVKDCKIRD